MTSPHQPAAAHDVATAPWRKSNYSGDQGSCVEAAPLVDGRIAIRNSNHPQAGVVFFTRAELDAWIKDVKAGKFDGFALTATNPGSVPRQAHRGGHAPQLLVGE